MSYTIVYGKHIDRKKLLRLPKNDRRRIFRMIEEKLLVDPENFGKPLRKSLRGHRSLRVGEYRVIFRIDGDVIFIELIGHRSIIYPDANETLS